MPISWHRYHYAETSSVEAEVLYSRRMSLLSIRTKQLRITLLLTLHTMAASTINLEACAVALSRRHGLQGISSSGSGIGDGVARTACTTIDPTVGVGGSASFCTRSFSVVVLLFPLPQSTAGAMISGARLNLGLSDVRGTFQPVLYGLGQRSPTDPPNPEADYYVGSADPSSEATLLSDSVTDSSLTTGGWLNYSSTVLTDYVRTQITGAGGAPTYLVLRLGAASAYGCDMSCDNGCTMNRLRLDLRRIQLALDVSNAVDPTSAWVTPNDHGTSLSYLSSASAHTLGDRVLDFSAVGFRQGAGGLPAPSMVPTRVALNSTGTSAISSTDDSLRIQAAINEVALMEMDPLTGFRGAVLLQAGTYHIARPLVINASGVILRGFSAQSTKLIASGDAWTSAGGAGGTSPGAAYRTLLQVRGASAPVQAHGAVAAAIIATPRVGVGSSAVRVSMAAAATFSAGDTVHVRWVPDAVWVQLIGMHVIPDCSEPSCYQWQASTYDLDALRVITAVVGDSLELSLPLPFSIDPQFGRGEVVLVSTSGWINSVGVEDLSFESEYLSGYEDDDEEHAWNALTFENMRDGYARGVTCRHFSFACVAMLRGAMHVTADSCASERPVSRVAGGRRYSFYVEGQANLVANCTSDLGRHSFVTSSRVVGPNAFVDCTATNALDDIGPHHRWAVGLLFDRVVGGLMSVENRGNSGSGHGWTGSAVVFWNCESNSADQSHGGAARLRVDAPPGSLSWSVGNTGLMMTSTYLPPATYSNATGGAVWEAHGRHVHPRSLFAAQLRARAGGDTAVIPAAMAPSDPPGAARMVVEAGGQVSISAGGRLMVGMRAV